MASLIQLATSIFMVTKNSSFINQIKATKNELKKKPQITPTEPKTSEESPKNEPEVAKDGQDTTN